MEDRRLGGGDTERKSCMSTIPDAWSDSSNVGTYHVSQIAYGTTILCRSLRGVVV